MTIVRNDLGNPSNQPCGATVFGICGSGDYDAWYATAMQIASKLSSNDDAASKAWLVKFKAFTDPDSILQSFFPVSSTQNLARHAQAGVDLIEELDEEVPASVTRNADLPTAPGVNAAKDAFKGIAVLGGIGILGFIVYQITR